MSGVAPCREAAGNLSGQVRTGQRGHPNCRLSGPDCSSQRKTVFGLCMAHYQKLGGPAARQTDTLSIGQAAELLGVTTDLVRSRVREGTLKCERTPGGHTRFDRAYIESLVGQVAVRPPGKPVDRKIVGRVELDAEGERQCLAIAEAAATNACKQIKGLDYDDALSDAMLGVATSLSRPHEDIPWNVSCWNYARWAILRGVRKRSGVHSRAWAAGMRYEALPEHLKAPISIDALDESEGDGWHPRGTVDDFSGHLIDRLWLEQCIAELLAVQRVALVNTVAHLFSDAEVAEGLGMRAKDVAALREYARQDIRRVTHA